MYKKELKESFKKKVMRQAGIASVCGTVHASMWICMNYFDGLNCALLTTHQFDNFLQPFTVNDFEYIFKSLVEYRKGAR